MLWPPPVGTVRAGGVSSETQPVKVAGGFLTRRPSGQARGGSSQVGCDPPEPMPRRPPSTDASLGNL